MPAEEIQSAPKRAPEFVTHRFLDNANDPLNVTDKATGINMAGKRYAAIQVHPDGGSNPAVSVHFWSEAFGKFVQEHTALDFAAKGVDVPWATTVECLGRIMLVKITGGNYDAIPAGKKCRILVAGFDGHD